MYLPCRSCVEWRVEYLKPLLAILGMTLYCQCVHIASCEMTYRGCCFVTFMTFTVYNSQYYVELPWLNFILWISHQLGNWAHSLTLPLPSLSSFSLFPHFLSLLSPLLLPPSPPTPPPPRSTTQRRSVPTTAVAVAVVAPMELIELRRVRATTGTMRTTTTRSVPGRGGWTGMRLTRSLEKAHLARWDKIKW